MRRLRALFYGCLLLLGVGAAALLLFFFLVIRDLPQVPEPLSRIIETPPTEIFAATGERIMLIGGREVVPLNRVSPLFIQAVTATEDHRFWEHHGFDKLRTVKALWTCKSNQTYIPSSLRHLIHQSSLSIEEGSRV